VNRGELRARLGDARLMLIFTPSIGEDSLAALEAVLPHVDVVQVRVKEADQACAAARESFLWAERVLDLIAARRAREVLVIVNDRVDVAAVLQERGVVGVHLGQDDTPVGAARAELGADALIGLSTHDMRQLALATEEPVDYLGFGPVFPTPTKGYEQGLGAEAAWIAAKSAPIPVFPIGGIDPTNAGELALVGRAAVASSLLAAPDPGAAARALRAALQAGGPLG
jgi:thiamine-phosphate diphosphorylase